MHRIWAMDDFISMDTGYSQEFWEQIEQLQNLSPEEILSLIEENTGRAVRFPEKMLLRLIIEKDKNLGEEQKKKHLLKDRIEQGDFFIAELPDLPYLRDDMASMENPLFALKPGDTRVIEYTSTSKNRILRTKIRSSVEIGRATIFDKDIWIYAISKLMQAKFEGKEINSAVEIPVIEFLKATNRGGGGRQYEIFKESLERLSGTRITTEIETGGVRDASGFGLLDEWRITEKGKNDIPLKVVIQLPNWLYRSIQSNEVLPISNQYFRLRKPIDRRIYEVARKFCGRQPCWKISLEKLHGKTGATMAIKEFRRSINSLIQANVLPDYKIQYDRKIDIVTFVNLDPDVQKIASGRQVVKLAAELLKKM